MLFIYDVRNKIVHKGRRLNISSEVFCDKSIATLKYLIYRCCKNSRVSYYVHSLYMQFNLQRTWIGEEWSLDFIEKCEWMRSDAPTPPVISTAQELDRHMFKALRFNARDRLALQ
jgi:hypothetical protein